MVKMKNIVRSLFFTRDASDDELRRLIDSEHFDPLFERANEVRHLHFGDDVYLRGLIEFSNYCKNDCFYCGLRASNRSAVRYRLTHDEILQCCDEGYRLGFRTFVLQSGEDPSFKDEDICQIVHSIKTKYSDCAVTLSIGEKSYNSYLAYFQAGADRYLLRHETASDEHYRSLHPQNMDPVHRKECLRNLKKIGYQVGSGFMVGTPGQTLDNLVQDLRFLQELEPHMIGIGPFIPHGETPFAHEAQGSLQRTLNLVAILRLMFPQALIPATTALGTIDPRGRELGLQAGANVVMPNLSPVRVRKLYTPYENKICTGEEAAQCRRCLERRLESVGLHSVVSRGDYPGVRR